MFLLKTLNFQISMRSASFVGGFVVASPPDQEERPRNAPAPNPAPETFISIGVWRGISTLMTASLPLTLTFILTRSLDRQLTWFFVAGTGTPLPTLMLCEPSPTCADTEGVL